MASYNSLISLKLNLPDLLDISAVEVVVVVAVAVVVAAVVLGVAIVDEGIAVVVGDGTCWLDNWLGSMNFREGPFVKCSNLFVGWLYSVSPSVSFLDFFLFGVLTIFTLMLLESGVGPWK